MNTYTYTALDGEKITGTLQDIGEVIIEWHGDRATQDNQEPWIEVDDFGTITPRDFTVDEWIEWAASAEDRLPMFLEVDLRKVTPI